MTKLLGPMPMDEVLALPLTFSLETAGRAYGFGRTKSHELARTDEFPCPVLKKGHSYVVTKANLFAALGIPPEFLFGGDPEVVRTAIRAAREAAAAA